MSADLLIALSAFAFVTSATPGPNNLMLLASGVNYGFRRTLPHMFGVGLGFGFMILVLGLGLSQLFDRLPVLHMMLRYGGGAYMLWLAWKIARSGPVGEGKAGSKPMSFLSAAAFQWVNPKAWVMAVGAMSAYAAVAPFPWNVVLVTSLFAALGFPSCGVWVLFGAGLKRVLTTARAVRAFNLAMAIALVASLWPVLAGK